MTGPQLARLARLTVEAIDEDLDRLPHEALYLDPTAEERLLAERRAWLDRAAILEEHTA
jgi:hypothetical protein